MTDTTTDRSDEMTDEDRARMAAEAAAENKNTEPRTRRSAPRRRASVA